MNEKDEPRPLPKLWPPVFGQGEEIVRSMALGARERNDETVKRLREFLVKRGIPIE